MTYPEQLKTLHWKKKREEILQRDDFKCQECLNEKLISKFDKGFFSSYCFLGDKEAINIENFGIDKFMRASIRISYSKFLAKNVVVYSKIIPGWKRTVFGVRKFLPIENEIYKKYNYLIKKNKINTELQSFEETQKIAIDILNLKEKKRLEFIEYNKINQIDEFEWIFMIGLHIHHKYYIKELYAWEYENNALVTLCESCHENLHKNQKIPVFNSENKFSGFYHYCKRCHGAGVFPEYSHVQNGICFRCEGLRYEELIIQ